MQWQEGIITLLLSRRVVIDAVQPPAQVLRDRRNLMQQFIVIFRAVPRQGGDSACQQCFIQFIGFATQQGRVLRLWAQALAVWPLWRVARRVRPDPS